MSIAASPPLGETIGAITPRPGMLLAGDNATVWQVPGGGNCDGCQAEPDKYAARMIDFFTTALAVNDSD